MAIADIVNGESVASVTSKLNAVIAVANDTVVGPDTSTDNAVAIFDSTGGHTLHAQFKRVQGGADTFGGTCWLLSSDLHIVKDDLGSKEEYVK